MDAEQLREWLLLQPRPTKLEIIDSNQERHELEIKIKKGATWKAVAESVLSLNPDSIRAFDGDKFVRGTKPGDVEEEEEEEAEIVVQDPESQRLIVFAKLLADGYKHANETAFRTLSDICRSMTERTQALEGALRSAENMMHENFRDAVIAQARAEVASAGEGEGDDVLGSMVKGLVHKATATPPPKPNGAAQ